MQRDFHHGLLARKSRPVGPTAVALAAEGIERSPYNVDVTDPRPGAGPSFAAFVAALHAQQVRFMLIGAWGANFHTLDGDEDS